MNKYSYSRTKQMKELVSMKPVFSFYELTVCF